MNSTEKDFRAMILFFGTQTARRIICEVEESVNPQPAISAPVQGIISELKKSANDNPSTPIGRGLKTGATAIAKKIFAENPKAKAADVRAYVYKNCAGCDDRFVQSVSNAMYILRYQANKQKRAA